MQFKLSKKSTGHTLTTFNITDDKDTICGSVNVPNEAVADLQKCWRDSVPAAATTAGKQARAANAMVAALKRGPRAKKGFLRGC